MKVESGSRTEWGAAEQSSIEERSGVQNRLGDVTFGRGYWEPGPSNGFSGDLHLPDGAFGAKSSLDGDLGNKMNSRGMSEQDMSLRPRNRGLGDSVRPL